MKILSFILSVYLLVLLLVPCCVFDECPEDKPVPAQAGNRTAGDMDDCGSCSPFFSCEGCAAFSVVAESFVMASPFTIRQQEYRDDLSFRLPAIQYDFWQPPRIS